MNNAARKSSTLWAAWCSSARRKMLWLLTAILVIVQVAQFDGLIGRQHVTSMHLTFPEFRVSGKHLQFSENQAPLSVEQRGEVEAITLFGGSNSKLLQSIVAEPSYPQLKSLKLMIPISAEELRQVARLPGLEGLTLMMSQGLSAAELSVLAEAESLTYLKVIEATGYDLAVEEIHWPSHLQQLCLQGPRGLPLRRLKELQTLPDLRTLSIRLDPVHPTSTLPEDVIATLQQFPRLQRLYLQEMGHLYPDLVTHAQRDLSGVTVRPSDYDRQRLMHAQVIMVLFGCWLNLIMIQLSAQFVGPQSLLVPNYFRPHLLIALAVLGFASLLNGALVLYHGLSLIGGVGLFGFATTFSWLMTRLYRSSDGAVPGYTQPFLAFPTLMFLTFTGLLLIYLNPADIDWWLRGELPLWSVFFFAVGVYGLYDMTGWLIGLPRLLEATNRGGVPLATLDLKAWQEWQLRTMQTPSQRGLRRHEFMTGIRHRLESVLADGPSESRRRRLWTASEPFTLTRMILTAATIMGVFTGVAAIWRGESWNNSQVLTAFAGGALGYLAMLSVIFPLVLLFQRHQTYAIELLRPVSRRDWIRDWFRITAVRLLPAVISTGLLIALAWWFEMVTVSSPAIWTGFIAVWATSWFLLFGLGMWLISYRWAPYLMAVLFPILMPIGMALFVGPMKQVWTTQTVWLWGLAAALMVLGGLSLWLARRRWWTWELGR
ncbi:hypothetical protein GC163_02160 [bacterium]|nr:hypothetical protein [bacterium]